MVGTWHLRSQPAATDGGSVNCAHVLVTEGWISSSEEGLSAGSLVQDKAPWQAALASTVAPGQTAPQKARALMREGTRAVLPINQLLCGGCVEPAAAASIYARVRRLQQVP